jgi:hypothetical protein
VSLFGFLSLGLIPIPLFFIRYGKNLRARSRFRQEAGSMIARMSQAIYKDEDLAALAAIGSPDASPSDEKKEDASNAA